MRADAKTGFCEMSKERRIPSIRVHVPSLMRSLDGWKIEVDRRHFKQWRAPSGATLKYFKVADLEGICFIEVNHEDDEVLTATLAFLDGMKDTMSDGKEYHFFNDVDFFQSFFRPIPEQNTLLMSGERMWNVALLVAGEFSQVLFETFVYYMTNKVSVDKETRFGAVIAAEITGWTEFIPVLEAVRRDIYELEIIRDEAACAIQKIHAGGWIDSSFLEDL
jgi:hypothetical protein